MSVNPNYLPQEIEEVFLCPWCKSRDWEAWSSQYDHFPPVKCKQCGVVFLSRRLNELGRKNFYKNYLQGHEAPERLAPRLKMYKQEFELIRPLVPSGNILDVGCGSGRFLRLFPPENYRRFGVEYGQEAANAAKNDLGKENVFSGGLLEADFPDGMFDLIIFRGVLEHLAEPREVLEKACLILKKNGYIFITSMPNLDSICAEVYRNKWTQHRELEHIIHFGKSHFRLFFQEHFFREVLDKELYWETPYAHPEEDILEVAEAIKAKKANCPIEKVSPAFWGNILCMVFKKL